MRGAARARRGESEREMRERSGVGAWVVCRALRVDLERTWTVEARANDLGSVVGSDVDRRSDDRRAEAGARPGGGGCVGRPDSPG